jgi:YbgC/YbaW family acyl-CoA thioester hydrolase
VRVIDPQGGRGPASIVIRRRIEWSDTDASGWYHNTAAFRFFEAAETSLLARLGFIQEVYGRHPRAHISADFMATLRFHDVVDILCAVAEVGGTSVTYDIEIRRGGEVCVRGRMVAVLLSSPEGRPTRWPDEYRRLLLTAGPQSLEDGLAG